MRTRQILACVVVAALAAVLPAAGQASKKKREGQPDIVTVQHVLISFGRKIPNKKIDRSKKEAEALAEQLLKRAQEGEDFDALVKEFTDDSYPGIYTLTNRGAPRKADSRSRGDMVPYFGDVAFRLEIGEIGMAKYHGGMSPYGWHIIKRLE